MDAMRNVQSLLKERKFEEAVTFLRACREIWPEDDFFGSQSMAQEDELLILKDIFLAPIPEAKNDAPAAVDPVPDEEEEDESDSEEEEGMGTQLVEQDFRFIDFVKRLAHSKVMSACTLLLSQFDKNSSRANSSALKMMHRVAHDCKMPAMLFQASLFRTFQRVFDSSDPRHKELAKFASFIIHKFAKVAEKNKKVFMELLFWKSSRDAYEIENGYGSYSAQTHSSKMVWTEEEEFELQRLHEEYMGKQEGSSTGVVDWIMENLINKERSKRGVVKKLKEMGIIVNAKAATKRPPKLWQPTEEEQLVQLFGQYRESADPLGEVMGRLTVARPRTQVVSKLLELGVVQDKKELRKKRTRKSRNNLEGGSDDDSAHSESSDAGSGSDSQGGSRLAHPTAARKAAAATRQPTKPRKTAPRSSQPKKSAPAVVFSREKASSAVENVITAGMQEALEWLRETLLEEASDREEEQPLEGVPILPLSEASVAAMDNPTFLRMVAALGLEKPLSTEGVYWRIPASLVAVDLRLRANIISRAIGLPVEGAEEGLSVVGVEAGRSRQSSESSGDEFERLKKMLHPVQNQEELTSNEPKRQLNRRDSGESLPAEEGEGRASSVAAGTRGEDASVFVDGKVGTSGRKPAVLKLARMGNRDVPVLRDEQASKSQKRKKIAVHSSDTESEEDVIKQLAVKSQKRKKIAVQSSDSEMDDDASVGTGVEEDAMEKVQAKKLLDSDSENEVSIRISAKRQPIIDDESD